MGGKNRPHIPANPPPHRQSAGVGVDEELRGHQLLMVPELHFFRQLRLVAAVQLLVHVRSGAARAALPGALPVTARGPAECVFWGTSGSHSQFFSRAVSWFEKIFLVAGKLTKSRWGGSQRSSIWSGF